MKIDVSPKCYNCKKRSHVYAHFWENKNKVLEEPAVSSLYITNGNLIVNAEDKTTAFIVETGVTEYRCV